MFILYAELFNIFVTIMVRISVDFIVSLGGAKHPNTDYIFRLDSSLPHSVFFFLEEFDIFLENWDKDKSYFWFKTRNRFYLPCR